jgi:uncharacterized integral membrane protein
MSVPSPDPSDAHAPPLVTAEPPSEEESRKQRLTRHRHRARLYAWAVLFIAGLILIIVLSVANVRSVKLDWVVGSTHASLVWIILGATVLGWLLGVATSILFRFRTRRRIAR